MHENIVSDASYLDMLQLWLFLQLAANSKDFAFQYSGTPPQPSPSLELPHP